MRRNGGTFAWLEIGMTPAGIMVDPLPLRPAAEPPGRPNQTIKRADPDLQRGGYILDRHAASKKTPRRFDLGLSHRLGPSFPPPRSSGLKPGYRPLSDDV